MEKSLKQFLNENSVIYKAIWYYINTNGKKSPIGEMNNMSVDDLKGANKIHGSKPKYIKRNGKAINLTTEEFNSLQKSYSIYLKHTSDLYCLDVDMPEIKSLTNLINYNRDFNIFEKCSWVKGNTKGIHIYLKCLNVPTYSSEIDLFKNIKGDLIHKNNNMWEKIDKTVSGSLQTFDFETIKPLLKDEVFNPELTSSQK